MKVTCDKCGIEYDDTYKLKYCPHDSFQMNTLAVRADGKTKVCTSVEELQEFIGDKREV